MSLLIFDHTYTQPTSRTITAEFTSHACKCAADAAQPLGKHFRVDAHTDSEVVRHFEKAARNCGGFEFRMQPFQEKINLTPAIAGQMHERGGAPICPHGGNGRLLREKIPKKFAICFDDP